MRCFLALALAATLLASCGRSRKLPAEAAMLDVLNHFQQHNVGVMRSGTRKVHVEDAEFLPAPQQDGTVRITYTANLVLDEPWVDEVRRSDFLKTHGFPVEEVQMAAKELEASPHRWLSAQLLPDVPRSVALDAFTVLKAKSPQEQRIPFHGEFTMQLYPGDRWGVRGAVQAIGEEWPGRRRSDYTGNNVRMTDSPDIVQIANRTAADAKRWLAHARRWLEITNAGVSSELGGQPLQLRAGDQFIGTRSDGQGSMPFKLRVDSVEEEARLIWFSLESGKKSEGGTRQLYSGQLTSIGASTEGVRQLLMTPAGRAEGIKANAAGDPLFALFARQLWVFSSDGNRLTGEAPSEKTTLVRARAERGP